MVNIVSLALIVILLCLVSVSYGNYEEIPNVASLDEDGHRLVFDFIVVGSGASGSIVATRLVQKHQRVVLLEGGAKGTGQRDIGGTDFVASDFVTDPVTGDQSLGKPWTRYDIPLMADSIRIASTPLKNMWDITPVGPFNAQAKVIGGNQATNGLAWQLPQNHDFDNWGVPGFDSSVMRSYLKKIENATETGYAAPNRGTAGPTNIRIPSFLPLEVLRFANASISAGYEIGGDFNSGNITKGIYSTQQSSKAGIRESSVTGYLLEIIGNNKLDFRTSAIVTKVLFNIFNRAIGVEYVNARGQIRQVFALKEVILSAGDLQTTKILFHSGIGPASVLNAFGIPHRVVNNVIGQKIRNHQRAPLTFADPTLLNANFFSYPAASVQFAGTGTGIFDRGGLTLSGSVDPSSPYPELLISSGGLAGNTPTNVYGQFLTVTVSLALNKYANGTLNLTSSDPLAPTIFTTNAFVVDDDVVNVAKGFLEVRRIMSFWNGSATEISPGPSYATVEDLVPWIRANAQTTCHYYGSAPMGTSSSSPTDTRWRVRGVTKLRIVGPSIVPGPVFLGMQGLAMALGEKGADLIIEDYGL